MKYINVYGKNIWALFLFLTDVFSLIFLFPSDFALVEFSCG